MPAQLQSVLDYLRSEGLISAEQALQKEVDEKYAVRPRPHGKSVALETSRPSTPGDWGSMDRGPSSRQHSIGHGCPPGEMDTAERCDEIRFAQVLLVRRPSNPTKECWRLVQAA